MNGLMKTVFLSKNETKSGVGLCHNYTNLWRMYIMLIHVRYLSAGYLTFLPALYWCSCWPLIYQYWLLFENQMY